MKFDAFFKIPMQRRHLLRTFIAGACAHRGLAAESTSWSSAEPHMGCLWTLTLPDLAPEQAAAAARATFAEIARLNGIFSDYEPTSELNRLCDRAGQDQAVPISAELFDILQQAYALSLVSNGVFDITIAPCVRLWRRSRRRGELPDAAALTKARALTGWQSIDLDASKRTARLTKPGMQLDLGGIAKGWTQDACLTLLRERFGITTLLLDAAGQVAAGLPPAARPHWKIALATPAGGAITYLPLREANIATSGDHYQFVEIDGTRYSHLIDPRTGLGATTSRQGTAIARTGVLADSLTKLLCLMEPETSLPLIQAKYPEVQARVTESLPDLALKSHQTPSFPASL